MFLWEYGKKRWRNENPTQIDRSYCTVKNYGNNAANYDCELEMFLDNYKCVLEQ